VITAIKVENEHEARYLIQLILAVYKDTCPGLNLDRVCPQVGRIYVDDVNGYEGWDRRETELDDFADFECEVKDFFL